MLRRSPIRLGDLDLLFCKNPLTPTIFDFEPFGENVEGLSLGGDKAYVAQRAAETNRIQAVAPGVV